MANNLIREKLKHLVKTSGCYLMKNAEGQIIYVGKAKNLKSRVSSYFTASKDHSVKTRALVAEIRDFDLMHTKTELEALILERTLIKHHKPQYNILLRDDKEYPYVKVNFKDTWPRIQKVRKRLDDGATYIGPFANSAQLKMLLKTIFRIFPLIRCSRYEFANAKRPCNYYHMKMCQAPCVLDVDRDAYVEIVRRALMILKGKNKDLLTSIKKEMIKAAGDEDFEEAAALRDQMFALEKIIERQIAVVAKTNEADIFVYLVKDNEIIFHITQVRDYKILGSENFQVPTPAGELEEGLSTFLLQYYENRYIPECIITDKEFSERSELAHLLCDEKKSSVKIILSKNKEEKDLIHFGFDNAAHYHKQQQEVKSKSKVELEMLRDTLGLKEIPKRMECIDISNTGDTAIVASNVCFIDGKPAKQFYRKYDIQSLEKGQDDFASMREVVERRIDRAIRDGDMPDLLVIDGGKGQLSAALDAKAKFENLEMNIVSLAKARTQKFAIDVKTARVRSEERIFVPGRRDPIFLKEGSPVFRLMSQIRDEAHRFAISYHRKKRQAQSMSSILDEVAGVGPVLKTRLLREFDGVEGLKKASLDQLQAVKGVSGKLAVAIHGILKS